MDEVQAIRMIKDGDLSGLELLVEKYQVKAVQTAYLIVNDRSLADDIAQNAFLRAAEKIHQFDERRRFGPWLFRIVANLALMRLREDERHVSLDDEDEGSSLPSWLADPAQKLEDLVATRETRQEVRSFWLNCRPNSAQPWSCVTFWK